MIVAPEGYGLRWHSFLYNLPLLEIEPPIIGLRPILSIFLIVPIIVATYKSTVCSCGGLCSAKSP